jgi:hypothetical protein
MLVLTFAFLVLFNIQIVLELIDLKKATMELWTLGPEQGVRDYGARGYTSLSRIELVVRKAGKRC